MQVGQLGVLPEYMTSRVAAPALIPPGNRTRPELENLYVQNRGQHPEPDVGMVQMQGGELSIASLRF